jgi:23S rRNA pseudouridine2605 synthase
MAGVRLQKYIADCGVCSRRRAEELIVEGRVRVNGTVVDEMGAKITPGVDRVTIGKKPVLMAPLGIVLLNKPRGVMSTRHDPGDRKTVMDYLGRQHGSYYPVGRLDYDSSGLVIMTNDGQLANRLMHPRYGMKRIYEVHVKGNMSEKTLRRINRGVRLDDGMVYADAKIKRKVKTKDLTCLTMTISEGRNRIIRRLMDHLRHPVEKLHRVAHGPFQLRRIKGGAIKELTNEEYQQIRDSIMDDKKWVKGAKKSSPKKIEKMTETRKKTRKPGIKKASPKRR